MRNPYISVEDGVAVRKGDNDQVWWWDRAPSARYEAYSRKAWDIETGSSAYDSPRMINLEKKSSPLSFAPPSTSSSPRVTAKTSAAIPNNASHATRTSSRNRGRSLHFLPLPHLHCRLDILISVIHKHVVDHSPSFFRFTRPNQASQAQFHHRCLASSLCRPSSRPLVRPACFILTASPECDTNTVIPSSRSAAITFSSCPPPSPVLLRPNITELRVARRWVRRMQHSLNWKKGVLVNSDVCKLGCVSCQLVLGLHLLFESTFCGQRLEGRGIGSQYQTWKD